METELPYWWTAAVDRLRVYTPPAPGYTTFPIHEKPLVDDVGDLFNHEASFLDELEEAEAQAAHFIFHDD